VPKSTGVRLSNLNFNLKVVLEGLEIMCASPEERKAHFAKSDSIIDENFDFVVLDFLGGAVHDNLIPKETAFGIEFLFKEAETAFKDLDWKQEDALLESNTPLVREWQKRMTLYIQQINAHNK